MWWQSLSGTVWRWRARNRLRRVLVRSILDFWRSRALADTGGYRIAYDHSGAPLPSPPATLVAQARQLWFFARLSRSPFGDAFSRDAARHGYEFLAARMRDPEHGGYFWDERDREAARPSAADTSVQGWWRTKHLYGQAFALFALSEYALSFASREAAASAGELFALIEQHGRHPSGGYREMLGRDWRPSPEGQRSYLGSFSPADQTLNTHIHLLEALMAYLQVDPSARVRAAIADLVALLAEHGTPYPPADGSVRTTALFADHVDPAGQRVLRIGHCLEDICYRLLALRALGSPDPAALAALRAQFEFVAAHGYDRANGGFFYTAALDGPAKDWRKVWWTQAEGLLASLVVHRACGGDIARQAFLGTLDWIERRQVDRRHGEWHAEVSSAGVIPAPKSGPWKEAYHNGRAMLDCIELLGAARRERRSGALR